MPTQDIKTKIRVDFVFSYSKYEKKAIKRCKKVDIGDVKVNFISVEDFVIHKLISARGRYRGHQKYFIKNPHINQRYVSKWLKKFDESLN